MEILGICTLIAAYCIGILNVGFAVSAMFIYLVMLMLTQILLVANINLCGVEPIPLRLQLLFLLVSVGEFLVYHFISTATKLFSFLTLRRKGNTWGQIKRSENTNTPDP